MSTHPRASKIVDAQVSRPIGGQKTYSRSKSNSQDRIDNQSVVALLQVDDKEYRLRIDRQANACIKDPNVPIIKRHMIPALPSRHGSRADCVVPLNSPARLRAERALSKASDFRMMFEDDDFSILDQPKIHENHKGGKEKIKKQDSPSHSMAMNVWRAHEVKSISPNQTKTRNLDPQHSSESLNATPSASVMPQLEALNSCYSDDSSEPWSSPEAYWMHAPSAVSLAQETLPPDYHMPISKSSLVHGINLNGGSGSGSFLHVKNWSQTSNLLDSKLMTDFRFSEYENHDTASSPCNALTVNQQSQKLSSLSLKSHMKLDKKKFANQLYMKHANVAADAINDGRPTQTFESDFVVCPNPAPAHVQKERKRSILPSLHPKARMQDQKQHHELLPHKSLDCKPHHIQPGMEDFKLIGSTIASGESVAEIDALFEKIEQNSAKRVELCSDIDCFCLKLQRQWQAKQKTILCQSNTRLQGSVRAQLMSFMRSLRENQDRFFILAQRCSVLNFGSSTNDMQRKITRWKQEIELHMHQLVKLPTIADVVHDIANEGKRKSNSFKATIGAFPGCADIDLAAAAACSKLLLGSRDFSTPSPDIESKRFRIFGNNIVPPNGLVSSILLSPSEPLETYNKVIFPTLTPTYLFCLLLHCRDC